MKWEKPVSPIFSGDLRKSATPKPFDIKSPKTGQDQRTSATKAGPSPHLLATVSPLALPCSIYEVVLHPNFSMDITTLLGSLGLLLPELCSQGSKSRSLDPSGTSKCCLTGFTFMGVQVLWESLNPLHLKPGHLKIPEDPFHTNSLVGI